VTAPHVAHTWPLGWTVASVGGDALTVTRHVLLPPKIWRLQREGRKSRRHSIDMQSDWLIDKPRSYYWLRLAARNLASQLTCHAGVTQSNCNPQTDFLGFLGRLLGPEEGMERDLGQTGDLS